ncbi:MAG: S8 family serine peptidase [Thermoanaerobaculum sp.]|nr:S8 family serine peptidase [Thermoanaerobaculum sp.]MDW7967896.1 S8 family serine peptidase [Thermoanaerobaculum sp.]
MARFLVWVVSGLLAVGPLGAGQVLRASRPVPGQYIVVLKDTAARAPGEPVWAGPTVAEVANEVALLYQAKVFHVYSHALKGFAVSLDAKQAERLADDPRVAWVEEDGVVTAIATQNNATWGLDRIDQRNLPLSGTYTYNTTASNVNVYIIDTGIRSTHNEFGGRVQSGYTAINDGRGTEDCNGHGTHVAGTAGGTTYGVAKSVRLYPVRVLDCNGSGTTSGVIAGVDWVRANHVKPAVANMSLGGGASSSLDTAVTNAINAGIVFVVAAGNDNADACNYSPARVSAAITVGSTTSSDARSSFSNYGTCLDIFAPGSNITSAWHTSNTATNTISGTSMASPHVAGAAALVLADNPSATPSNVASTLINNATQGVVTGAGTGSPNRLLYTLFGGSSDSPPVARFTYSCNGLTCTFDGSSSSDDVGISSYSWNFGDGTTGTGVTTSKTYAASGTYSVTLTVRDTAGQTGSQTQSVSVSSGAPCTNCEYYTGTLSGTGASAIQPNGSYYYSAAGVHQGWLRGPAGTDFDLYLQRWNGVTWTTVARSEGSTSTEYISHNGTAGYYRWRIYSYSGSGTYQFWLKRP